MYNDILLAALAWAGGAAIGYILGNRETSNPQLDRAVEQLVAAEKRLTEAKDDLLIAEEYKPELRKLAENSAGFQTRLEEFNERLSELDELRLNERIDAAEKAIAATVESVATSSIDFKTVRQTVAENAEAVQMLLEFADRHKDLPDLKQFILEQFAPEFNKLKQSYLNEVVGLSQDVEQLQSAILDISDRLSTPILRQPEAPASTPEVPAPEARATPTPEAPTPQLPNPLSMTPDQLLRNLRQRTQALRENGLINDGNPIQPGNGAAL